MAATLGDALMAATRILTTAGVPDPRREALQLAAALRDSDAAALMLRLDEAVEPGLAAQLRAGAARRASGEPLAYVTGAMGFRHLIVRCDKRALIPRPETEGLVSGALSRCSNGVAADVGTGTGAIAIALCLEGQFDAVIGIDLSTDALALARENGIASNAVVSWLAGDLVEPLIARRVQLLVSNPPYLTDDEYGAVDPSVRDYEPRDALISGRDGLDHTRRLLRDGRKVVANGGWIALEIDCRRATEVSELARHAGWKEITVQDDLFGRARYLFARQERHDD